MTTLAKLKISTNLFLGAVELERLTWWWKQNNSIVNAGIDQYGIVRGYGVGESSGFRIIAGGTPDKLTISAGTALVYDSTDEEIRLIHIPSSVVDVADVPTDSSDYYVKLVHLKSSLEEGTCSVSASGQLTGVGTSFLTSLRAQPGFPSKIAFEKTGLVNTGEYEVVTITNDTTAQLSGSFTLETGLRYKSVGTFTPNVIVSPSDKFIFEYNSYEIVVEASSTVNNTDEFLLAKVSSDGITLTIEDYRTQWAKTLAEEELTEFDDSANAVIGVEWAKYDTVYSSRESNLVKLGWGYRAANGNWSANSDLQRITITSGEGGIFDTGDAVTDNIMDGWRVYFGNSGKYVRVVTQTYSGGNVILNLDRYSTSEFPASGTGAITVVPDCDKIAIRTVSRSATVDNTVEDDKSFPIHYGEGIMRIKATGAKIQYRQMWGRNTGVWRDINDGDYIDESSWNDDGTLNVVSLSSVSSSEITLLLNPYSYATNGMKKNAQNAMIAGGAVLDYYTTALISAGVVQLPSGGASNLINVTSASTTITGIVSHGTGMVVTMYFTNSHTMTQGTNLQLGLYTGASLLVSAGQTMTFFQSGAAPTWVLVSVSEVKSNNHVSSMVLNAKQSTSDKLGLAVLNDSVSSRSFNIIADPTYSVGGLFYLPANSGMLARWSGSYVEEWIDFTIAAPNLAGATFVSVASARYKILGKTCFINISGLVVTLASASPSIVLSGLTIGGGTFTTNNHSGIGSHVESTDIVGIGAGYALGSNIISFNRGNATNFPTSTNTLSGSLVIELQ